MILRRLEFNKIGILTINLFDYLLRYTNGEFWACLQGSKEVKAECYK